MTQAVAANRVRNFLREPVLVLRNSWLGKYASPWFPTLRISRGRWIVIWLLGILLGLVIYGSTVGYVYWTTEKDMQTAGADFMRPWPNDMPAVTIASATLGEFGIPNSDLNQQVSNIVADFQAKQGGNQKPSDLPIMGIVSKLLLAQRHGASQVCENECQTALSPVLTRMLLGWPGKLDDEVQFLRNMFNGKPTAEKNEVIGQACRQVTLLATRKPWLLSPKMLWGGESPWSAPRLAQLVMGNPAACQDTDSGQDEAGKKTCKFLTGMFQSLLDDSKVRDDRSGKVNFFYGWERALVAILFIVVGLAIFHRFLALLRLEDQRQWLLKRLDQADERLSPHYGPSRNNETAENQAGLVRKEFLEKYFPEFALASDSKRNPKELDTAPEDFSETVPKEKAEPILEIVNAFAESVTRQKYEHLEALVDLNLSEIDGSREFLNGLITVFPAIGFSATLLSLVSALAGANQIATSTGGLRSAAILNITALLSSCFATTFLALISMAFFAIFSLLQAGAEKRLMTTIHEKMIAVFWPNR